MTQKEKEIMLEYFLAKINVLENEFILHNNNLSKYRYKYCDAVDFLELMLIKEKMEWTVSIIRELKQLLSFYE